MQDGKGEVSVWKMDHSPLAGFAAIGRPFLESKTCLVAQFETERSIRRLSTNSLIASHLHRNAPDLYLRRHCEVLGNSSGWSLNLLNIVWKSTCGRCHKRKIAALNAHDGGLASKVLMSFPSSVPLHVSVQSTVTPSQAPGLGSRTVLPLSPKLVESFNVTGGSKLSGHVHISGAKNSALAVLAGSLCSSGEVFLRMVPELLDTQKMLQVLTSLGAYVRQSSSGISVNARNLSASEPCAQTVQKLRAGFFVIGALVARHGEATLALPGGCDIGSRPIDLHLRGLEALGAKVEVRQDKVHAWVAGGTRLTGGKFHLDFPSVGATETLMMAACLADGETVLSNVAQEPEIIDLAQFLVSCGAKIQGAGTSNLVIKGVKRLHEAEFSIIPDRIEAGTFLIAAAITRSAISLSPVIPLHLTAVVDKLKSIGCKIGQLCNDALWISSPTSLRNSEMITGPYPGFPTDLQPQLMSLMTTCYGQSIIMERIFEDRMGHVGELQKLGAKVKVSRSRAVISGINTGSLLSGAPVKASDLRAGAALILAGMAAEGITHIEGANHIDRGYVTFDKKLRLLGANIERLP